MEAERKGSLSTGSAMAVTTDAEAASDSMSAEPAKIHSAVPEQAFPESWSGHSPQWLVEAEAAAARAQALATVLIERKAATTPMTSSRPLQVRCIRRKSLSTMS